MAGVRPMGSVRRILIAGSNGMLGTALKRVAARLDIKVVSPPEDGFDITDESQVRLIVGRFALEGGGVFINAAAYTDVESAEDHARKAFEVNAEAPGLLARIAYDAQLPFVHVSTDFVFDGEKNGPYVETDAPHPLSVYGASKLAGEKAVAEENPEALIVRTAWVFGPNGNNFPTKILEAASKRPEIKVVTDEIGSPTYTIDLACGILGLAGAGASGLYHLAGAGSCSRFDLAAEILRVAGLETKMRPVTSDAFPTKAVRPRNSVLDCSKAAAVGVTMPPWEKSIARFVAAHIQGTAEESA